MIYRAVKRTFDILFAVLFLIAFSPIYLITAIIIKIVSPGPVLYKARRVGLNGKVFTCYKFRSMLVDSGRVHITTLANDDRVFPFGKFIRKAKIDEMPQAWNILKGQMSVVGPRPEEEEIADMVYVGKYKHIMDVRPGLTSPASLYDYTHGEKYKNEESYKKEFLPKKPDMELYYVKNQGVWYDLRLIIRTAVVIIQMLFGKESFKEPKELVSVDYRVQG